MNPNCHLSGAEYATSSKIIFGIMNEVRELPIINTKHRKILKKNVLSLIILISMLGLQPLRLLLQQSAQLVLRHNLCFYQGPYMTHLVLLFPMDLQRHLVLFVILIKALQIWFLKFISI